MQIIVTVALTLAVTMAAVDPRAMWCESRCQALHETDCPDQDQCPEISSEEADSSEEDTLGENSICVSPCEDLKNSCTPSCYKAYSVCQAGCRSSSSRSARTSPPQSCFRPCFEEKFEQLQEEPSP